MTSGFDTDVNRSLSSASDALDTRAGTRPSLLYRELTMRSRRRLTSAWYSLLSPPAPPLAGFSSVAASARTTTSRATRGRAAASRGANDLGATSARGGRRARARRERAARGRSSRRRTSSSSRTEGSFRRVVTSGAKARRVSRAIEGCRRRAKKSGGGDKKAPQRRRTWKIADDRFNSTAPEYGGGRNVK